MIDLVMGFFIFVLIFTSVLSAVNKNTKDFTRNMELNEINHSSFFVLKELTETKGYPENWEDLSESHIERIGLMERNQISEDKLTAFSNLDYNKSRELLGLEGYDYYFVLTQGVIIISAGLSPASQTEYLISTKRIVNYRGSEAQIELQVYELWE